jgi:heme exporter protein A
MIRVEGLVKAYGLQPVLRGLDLQVERGQCLALFGPNGSGKSTLLRILATLAKPNRGLVQIGGWDLPKEAFAVRRQLGVVSHLPLLYDNLTAQENLRFFARLYALPPESIEARVEAVLTQVNLKYRATDPVRTFSRGMLQRLTIARAILHDPAVLLFDEPYTGLDQQSATILDALIRDLARQGRTLLMSTHDLGRGHALASHVAILSRGKIAFWGATSDVPAEQVATLYAETIGVAS